MANRWFTQFFGTMHKKPVTLDCNFVVDVANPNGAGVRSLKGPGISNVFMNTTATITGDTHTNLVIDNISGGTGSLVVGMKLSGTGIAAGTSIASITSSSAIATNIATTATNAGVTIATVAQNSPNPAAGNILIQFQDNYNRYYFGTSGFISPVTGTPIVVTAAGAHLTVGQVYVIVVVGTTTAANWVTLGVPVGTTPAVGVAFVAAATGAGVGSGVVELASVSGITSVEGVGNPNLTMTSLGPTNVAGTGSGAYILVQCLGATSSSVTTLIKKAPADGSVIGLSFFLGNSSILQQGE